MFDGIVGQERAKETLVSMVESEKMPHTLLFTGPYGVGKGETALDLARMLVCTSGPLSGCMDCGACRRAAKLVHPDLHVLFPFRAKVEKKDFDEEAFQARIRQIADEPYPTIIFEKGLQIVAYLVDEIRERLLESSFEGGRRVCVILSAERLNRTTGNRLLKILEEPPDDVHFILTAERVSSMLPTIVSRSTVIGFRRLRVDEIEGYLERKYPELTAEERKACALLGEGGIKRAKSYAVDRAADVSGKAREMYEEAARGGEEAVTLTF